MIACQGCGESTEQRLCCPRCRELGRSSFFCSQPCFHRNWQYHSKVHRVLKESETYILQNDLAAFANVGFFDSAHEINSDEPLRSSPFLEKTVSTFSELKSDGTVLPVLPSSPLYINEASTADSFTTHNEGSIVVQAPDLSSGAPQNGAKSSSERTYHLLSSSQPSDSVEADNSSAAHDNPNTTFSKQDETFYEKPSDASAQRYLKTTIENVLQSFSMRTDQGEKKASSNFRFRLSAFKFARNYRRMPFSVSLSQGPYCWNGLASAFFYVFRQCAIVLSKWSLRGIIVAVCFLGFLIATWSNLANNREYIVKSGPKLPSEMFSLLTVTGEPQNDMKTSHNLKRSPRPVWRSSDKDGFKAPSTKYSGIHPTDKNLNPGVVMDSVKIAKPEFSAGASKKDWLQTSDTPALSFANSTVSLFSNQSGKLHDEILQENKRLEEGLHILKQRMALLESQLSYGGESLPSNTARNITDYDKILDYVSPSISSTDIKPQLENAVRIHDPVNLHSANTSNITSQQLNELNINTNIALKNASHDERVIKRLNNNNSLSIVGMGNHRHGAPNPQYDVLLAPVTL